MVAIKPGDIVTLLKGLYRVDKKYIYVNESYSTFLISEDLENVPAIVLEIKENTCIVFINGRKIECPFDAIKDCH